MKEIIRMNQLAGIITEGQARKMMAVLNEIENKSVFDFVKQNLDTLTNRTVYN